MLRLRRARNLDLRLQVKLSSASFLTLLFISCVLLTLRPLCVLVLQTLLEAAYFAVKPPERAARKNKTLTNVQKYIRFLLFEKLDAPGANGKCQSTRHGGQGHFLLAALSSAHLLKSFQLTRTFPRRCLISGPRHQGVAEAALAKRGRGKTHDLPASPCTTSNRSRDCCPFSDSYRKGAGFVFLSMHREIVIHVTNQTDQCIESNSPI